MTTRYTLLVCLFAFPFITKAQDALTTDRPGEGTNSAKVVAKGRFQLETGFYYQHDVNQEGNEDISLLLPNAVARLGLLDHVELRLERNYISDGEQLGRGSLKVGTKVSILRETSSQPALALQALLTLPRTGSGDYKTKYSQPAMLLLLSKSLNNFLSITTNLGAGWENDHPRAIYTYGLSFDFSLTGKLSAFIETYGALPEGKANQHLLDYGLTYLVTRHVQLDVSSGAALSREAPDYFVSLGLSWRVPLWNRL